MGRVMQNVFPAAGAACAKVLKLPEPSKVCFEEPIEGQCVQSWGFPGGASGEEPACQCRRCKRHGFNPWVGKIPWRREWRSIPVFFPGESHGQRSLAGYSLEGLRESDMTEAT